MMNLHNKFIAVQGTTSPYTGMTTLREVNHSLPISKKFLELNQECLDKFEKDLEAVNAMDSDEFMNWLETASPIAIENYTNFLKIKSKKPNKIIDAIFNLIEFGTDVLSSRFVASSITIIGTALLITGSVVGGVFAILGFVFLMYKISMFSLPLALLVSLFLFCLLTSVLMHYDYN